MGAVPNLNPSPFATLGSSKHGFEHNFYCTTTAQTAARVQASQACQAKHDVAKLGSIQIMRAPELVQWDGAAALGIGHEIKARVVPPACQLPQHSCWLGVADKRTDKGFCNSGEIGCQTSFSRDCNTLPKRQGKHPRTKGRSLHHVAPQLGSRLLLTWLLLEDARYDVQHCPLRMEGQ